jgi:hypothetical protein
MFFMKFNWTKYFVLLPLFGLNNTHGQATFNTIEYLDINRFNIGHMLHGDMWYDAATYNASCEYPKGTGKHATYAGSLWTVANDGLGNDYTTAQVYRGSGIDYWPGPLDAAGTCSYATSEKWARIWKVSHTDINSFKSLSSRTVSTVPKNILEWPAKGNLYAKGGSGMSLTITEDMAPFIDTDGDGLYDPIKGDYPQIKGDQMLWWIFNDNGVTHTSSKGTPFKIEYRAVAYAYSRGGTLDNVVYYEFDMRNKSSIRYLDFRFGLFSDADLGGPFDDYIAFDSTHRMGILYNSRIPDAPNGANSYGDHPPLVGVSFIEMPGDIYPGGMKPAGTFNYFENTLTGPIRDPRNASEFTSYMYAKDADGNPRYFGNYAFPITKGAIQCDSSYPGADRRFVTTTGNYNFQPGTREKVAMALIATDTTGNACGSLNFKELTDAADSAWKVYYNPLPPLGVKEIAALDQKLRIYPNPAESVLLIDSYTGKTLKAAQLKVYDATGRMLQVPVSQSSRQISIDVSTLAAGVYSLVYSEGEQQATQQFIKK